MVAGGVSHRTRNKADQPRRGARISILSGYSAVCEGKRQIVSISARPQSGEHAFDIVHATAPSAAAGLLESSPQTGVIREVGVGG